MMTANEQVVSACEYFTWIGSIDGGASQSPLLTSEAGYHAYLRYVAIRDRERKDNGRRRV